MVALNRAEVIVSSLKSLCYCHYGLICLAIVFILCGTGFGEYQIGTVG